MSSTSRIGWPINARAGLWILVSLTGAGTLAAIALRRNEPVNAMWIIIASVCVYLV